MKKKLLVLGNHTNAGKTIVSTILAVGLQAYYWKPIQTGSKEGTDSEFVAKVIGTERVFPEAYCFREPLSPDQAARLENKTIDLGQIQVPDCNHLLLIEGAGGVHSPINHQKTQLDFFAERFPTVPVILVSGTYLGSINHTLLSIEAILKRSLPLLGIIFSGEDNPESRDFILSYSNQRMLGYVTTIPEFTFYHFQMAYQQLSGKDWLESYCLG